MKRRCAILYECYIRLNRNSDFVVAISYGYVYSRKTPKRKQKQKTILYPHLEKKSILFFALRQGKLLPSGAHSGRGSRQ